MLLNVDWTQFKLKNPNQAEAFEELCYHLFCRKYKITDGLRSDYNQIGLETYPTMINDELTGFQAKFFENKLSEDSSVKQIKESIKKAINAYPGLKRIIIYTHQSFGSSDPKYKRDIEKQAGNIKIEWIVESNLRVSLTQPINLDLLQLYFDHGDVYGFIKNNSNKDLTTLIASSEYTDLPLDHDGNKKLKDIIIEKNKTCLLLGDPGSGKSVIMHRLFQVIGGLDKNSIKDMRDVLSKNKVLPMLINLKDCSEETLENIVRNRKSDYKLNYNSRSSFKIVYLFDGLDELDEESADRALSYISTLANSADTNKIVISCRTGNLNRLKAKEYLKVAEYYIQNLSNKKLIKYFKIRKDSAKTKKLTLFKRKNPSLVNEINDIFLFKLLWETINDLDRDSTVVDLFDKKIQLLLTDPRHRKYLDKLNLLNPKKKTIYSLNQTLSLRFQKKYQFRINHKNLQEFILTELPRIDYTSTNNIVNYLCDLFFNSGPADPDDDDNVSYAYQHRRYQEFFFAKELKELYEVNPLALREFNILSNYDFFYEIFLNYLKRQYLKERNLSRLLEVSLFYIYAGKHRGWGADDPYYANSSEFIPALASQNDASLDQLVNDENLSLRSKIIIDIVNLKDKFKKWKRDKKNWRVNDYLKSVWESGVSELISFAQVFNTYRKNSFVLEIKKNLQEVLDIFEKNKYVDENNKNESTRLADPFWKSIEGWIYFRLVINNEKVENILKSLIRKNYEYLSDKRQFITQESNKEILVKSFFKVVLKWRKSDLNRIIDSLDDFEWIALLEVLLDFDHLPLLFKNVRLRKQIKNFLGKNSKDTTQETYFLIFYKRLFGIALTKEDEIFGKTEIEKYVKERHFEWNMYHIPLKYALINFGLGEQGFVSLYEEKKTDFRRYYHELELYSFMFDGYIRLFEGKSTVGTLVRDYKKYIITHETIGYGLYLKVDISFFWAHIFNNSGKSVDLLSELKTNLFKEENNLILLSFYIQLKRIGSDLFNQLANESEIKLFEDDLAKWNEDYPSYIDRCFYLGEFYADINPQKAVYFIYKGINDGILRHGWHKDFIVSYLLVNALEILWKNNYMNKDELIEWTRKVYKLTVRVKDITDGDETSSGPYNVIKLASKYDLPLAIELKDNLIEHLNYHNYGNSAITYILLAKVNYGESIESLEEEMMRYRTDYDYEGKPQRDSYEEKIQIYLAISESDAYSKSDQINAFNKAYDLVNDAIKNKVEFFLNSYDTDNIRNKYLVLCGKFGKKQNLPTDPTKQSQNIPQLQKIKPIPETEFIHRVKKAKTKTQIRKLINKLGDYKQGIELKKFESWNAVVKQVFKIDKSIKILTDFLKKLSYPHTDFYTTNSKYLHYCVAASLRYTNTKEEMLDYLFENGGHGGFINVMKSYEVNKDKEMCVNLFIHFYNFCNFLVF